MTSVAAFAAPDRTQKLDTGLIIGGLAPVSSDGDIEPYWGGNFSYGINEWSAMGLSVGATNFKLKVPDASGNKISAGKVQAFPIFVDIIFRANTLHESLEPYAVLGVGGIYTHRLTSEDLSGGSLHVKSSNDFAAKIGVGVDWFYHSGWIFNLEFNYVYTGASVDVIKNSDGLALTNENIDYWFIGLGTKYLFE